MKKKRSALKNLALAIAVITLFLVGAVVVLNQPETIRYVLNAATVRSPLQIDFTDYNWNLFTSRMEIKGLHIKHKENEREIFVKDLSVRYRPLNLLLGKFVISSFEIDGVVLGIPKKAVREEKGRLRFDITRLIILQNLTVRNGIVRGIDASLPNGNNFKSDEFRFELVPALMGGTELKLRFDGLVFSRKDRQIANLASLTLNTSTSLSEWKSQFPYINALSGKLEIDDARLQALEIEKITAGLKYFNQDLKLDPFEITIKGRNLKGLLNAGMKDESFEASLNIPKPISLPYIGAQSKTFDTAGELAGSVVISGKGFVPSESTGSAFASFAHRFTISPAVPVVAAAKAKWDNGVIRVFDGTASAENDTAQFDGTVDINKKKISFKGGGTNFPVEHFFGKFRNSHFHPIFGKSDFTVSFDGWAKNFVLKVKGTTHNGGYRPIVADIVETEVEVTYDRMAFNWKIIQGGRQTGTADLVVRMGGKLADGTRAKDVDLKGALDRHPLAASLSDIGVSGTGSGDIVIKGPHLNFTGRAGAVITDGKWFVLPFDRAVATLDISRRKITFKDIQIELRKLKPIIASQPLTMDLFEGGLRLWGTPDPKLTLDIGYQYAAKKWQFKKISYVDPATSSNIEVSGSYAKGGGIGLNAAGSVDLAVLAPLGFLVREASGPADIKLSAQGSASSPGLTGRIEFKNCLISPRAVHVPLEHLKGNVIFAGHEINFDNITAETEDGRFDLRGKITHSGLKIANADLVLNGKDLRYRTEDGAFKMDFDGNLKLTGQFPQPLLSGDITVLEGKYTKDFNLLESLTRSKEVEKKLREREIGFSPRLDLHVRNTGDLFIKNNIGDIGLRVDLNIKGTRKSPSFGGTVNVNEGKISYLGMNFDVTRGLLEFRESSENPYLEVVAQKEIDIYNVTVEVHGNIDNLAIDLSATSPTGSLEKKDVISLILFGITETERQQMASQTGQQFGVAMAAQQLTHVVERPITKFAHLDTFRLEAADPTKQSISRIKVGKQLSDRLSVDFATDINTQDATQTVTGEYLFTDNILIKGSRSSNGRYEMDGAIRFRLR